MRLTFSYHSRLTCSFEKAPTPRTLTGTVTIRSTTYVTNTASESFPIATLTGSNGKDLQSGTGGYSISDKIALGVGLGLGIPTLLVTLWMCARSGRSLRPRIITYFTRAMASVCSCLHRGAFLHYAGL